MYGILELMVEEIELPSCEEIASCNCCKLSCTRVLPVCEMKTYLDIL